MANAAQRICLFGGSFDPVHNRHIQIASDALKQFLLDKVIFIPTLNPPHKNELSVSLSDRIKMLSLAIASYRNMEVSAVEAYRSGKSYTYDTVMQIKKIYPQAELYYIIGEDSLNYVDQWYRAKELFSLITFIVCDRFADTNDRRTEIEAHGAKLLFLDTLPLNISSTKIRESLAKNEFTADIPLPVYEYIAEASLYGMQMLPKIFRVYLDKLATLINDKRMAHSLCVAYTARELAKLHHVDTERATCAGILHDCAKALPLSVMQGIAKKNKLYFDEEIYHSPLLHAPIGAEIAKELFGVEDPHVYSAITYHTTGMSGMNALDSIVYLADKIEPTRPSYPQLEEIKQKAKINLNAALLLSIESTNNYLKLMNKSVSRNTLRLMESLKNNNS